MKAILFILAMMGSLANANSVRTVTMKEGDMAKIHVSPRFSTLIKFDAHPEPGLIGDQDAFKVEYMRNMVAIKPFVSKSSTNLFLFTKEGQFNFQLVASGANHDNIVHVKRYYAPEVRPPQVEYIHSLDELLSKKIEKNFSKNGATLRVESIGFPPSRSTLLVRFTVDVNIKEKSREINRDSLFLRQGSIEVPIENAYFERSKPKENMLHLEGLFLVRSDSIQANQSLTLCLSFLDPKKRLCDLAVSFSPSLPKR